MPISTPYRQDRTVFLRRLPGGGVVLAVMVVAFAAAVTLPQALSASNAGDNAIVAQRIDHKGGWGVGGHSARFKPGQSVFRSPV